ncbi:MAG: 7-cyano-7-deazaguanine synthase QueC [Candidatus Omnitrophica bacterium]|nr:7-cyano-7-deazaguanine synthase QueC [Candidatus Omnitrophota bacterium]MCM8788471.1 7-cyano-7-deazaguanine synthase QueC [Candidatus Omnitrophota bacterium]
MKSVVLISGGIDSFVAAAVEKSQGRRLYAMTVNYGQVHRKEIDCARKIGQFLSVCQHRFLDIDLSWLPSSLTDIRYGENRRFSEIPPSYVPARNIIFLSLATAYAESLDADAIVIGVHSVDYSGYPDCRQKFIEAFQMVIDTGIKKSVEGGNIILRTPLLLMKKSEIIKLGKDLGVDFSLTWSCYKGGEKACGVCDSCKIRLAAFSELGLKDPADYEK